MLPELREGPATVTYCTIGRRYTVVGRPGLEYLGRTEVGGLHVFRAHNGCELYSDDHLASLMQAGSVRPEGPA